MTGHREDCHLVAVEPALIRHGAITYKDSSLSDIVNQLKQQIANQERRIKFLEEKLNK